MPIVCLAQDNYNVSFKNSNLSEVLKSLESNYNLVFSYTSDLITEQEINVKLSTSNLEKLLSSVFKNTNLTFEIFDDNYIVLKAQQKVEHKLCLSITTASGEPLPFASLYIPKHNTGTSANEDGQIQWRFIHYDFETIELSYIGFEKKIISKSTLLDCPEIIMTAKEFSFAEVIVKDYVTGGIEQSLELDHMTLRPDRLTVIPGLTDADVLQMVQILPGVESIDESATGLQVRGGTSDQNLILYDGIPIYNSGHFFGMISAFNPSIIDKVNVHLSGFGPNYGGRLSSVIDIKSIDRAPDRTQFNAGINFTHGDISMAIPLIKDKLAIVLGGRKSYTDIIETPTYQKLSQRIFRKGKIEDAIEEDDPEVIDFNLGFDFNDYNVKMIYELGPKDHLTANFFQIDDNLDFTFNDFTDEFRTNDILKLSNTGIGFNWQRSWSDKLSSNLSISQTALENSYTLSVGEGDDIDLEVQTMQINNIDDRTLLLENTLHLNDRFNINFGFQFADIEVERQWIYFETDFEENEEEDDEDIITDENQISSSFLSLNSNWNNKFRSELGLRWNYAFATNEYFAEPRALIQFLPTKDLQIKASGGLYHQFMNQVIELNDLGLNQNFWVLADDEESTPISKSTAFTLGLLYHPKSFQIELEAYYKNLNGLTTNLSEFDDDEDISFDEGSGISKGINLMIKKRVRKLETWVSYSYSATDYTFDLEEGDLEFRAPHDRPHSFKLAGQLKHNNWTFSLSWKLASGIRYTPVFELEEDEDDAFPLYEYDDINTAKLPAFHRLDFSAMKEFKFGSKGLTGQLGFSFLNLYNRENILSREYFSVLNEETETHILLARDRAMLRFTPNVVFRLSFK